MSSTSNVTSLTASTYLTSQNTIKQENDVSTLLLFSEDRGGHREVFLGTLFGALFLGFLALLIIRLRRKLSPNPRARDHRSNSSGTGTRPLPNIILPSSADPSPRGAYLESQQDAQVRRFALKLEGMTIGRASDNELVVDDKLPGWETVSAHHARISYVDNDWRLEDLHATNGVYVNGQRTGRNILRDGWEISVGEVKFIFHTSGGEM
jgi:hypothetical protein